MKMTSVATTSTGSIHHVNGVQLPVARQGPFQLGLYGPVVRQVQSQGQVAFDGFLQCRQREGEPRTLNVLLFVGADIEQQKGNQQHAREHDEQPESRHFPQRGHAGSARCRRRCRRHRAGLHGCLAR